ncbi:UDP-Glycosyltransferase superfamily protein [Artemisia annua]|uniref:UDP-Glycosyltransferase superfamily protein n=1 Tax=Artemisia annua TaxID=35608 RepID=A0A2U1NU69_ARTAN|nr:UDP-Glycosyltransferase superfamily protein [Artemisia annua]
MRFKKCVFPVPSMMMTFLVPVASQVSDRERLPLEVIELGTCDKYPQDGVLWRRESDISPDANPVVYLEYLNKHCVGSFKECVVQLLAESDEGSVGCLITDAGFYFPQDVANELSIPRLVLRTSSVASLLVYGGLITLTSENDCYFNPTKQDLDYNAPLKDYPIMKVKDVLKISANLKSQLDFLDKIFKHMKTSSGIIWNTFKELEQPELNTINQQYQVPSFTLGPFHKYFRSSLSSLIKQDETVLKWLDTQPPKSTIYVSFGSLACITESEFQQVALGLENIGLPFLWVVRPGLVTGSEWAESLPEKFLERVGDRGRIVKWCPQQEVLAHPATGCFWTHNGWNSTLESICEGVPMLMVPAPFQWITNNSTLLILLQGSVWIDVLCAS